MFSINNYLEDLYNGLSDVEATNTREVEEDLWGYKDDEKFKEIFGTDGGNQNGKIAKSNN